jgi:hypothetical protein
MTEKIYHIYAKNQCIYHNLSEEEFTKIWDMLHRMFELIGANISSDDISYEELIVSK